MAEWGKGDPRWIVEDRQDGKNVNAWHWEEKDCTKWALAFAEREFPAQLTGANDDGSMNWTFGKFSDWSGELMWYNRKGKLFTLYDMSVKIAFSGTYQGTQLKGTLKVNDFEQDCEDDSDWSVSIENESSLKPLNCIPYKRWIKKAAKASFITCWRALVEALHEMQKEKNSSLRVQMKEKTIRTSLPKLDSVQQSKPQPAKKVSTATSSHQEAVSFQAPPEELWSLFTVEGKASYFTMAQAKIEPKEGGVFSLYDGTISGTFIELKPHSKMSFTWRLKDWPEGVQSTVTIQFEKSSDGTTLTLNQVGVPSSDLSRTASGWTRYYWDRFKGVFGFGFNRK